jgi:LemA protein
LLNAQTPADKIAANQQVTGALGRLLAISENYPQLKSNENFLRLQDELAGSENRIAIERRKYNETVQRYNTDIELFPNNIAASMFGFQRNDAYFKTEPGARTVPKVSF